MNVEVGDSTKNETNLNRNSEGGVARNQNYDGQPKDADVLFGESRHPGTKACMHTIKNYMKKHPGVSFGPQAYEALLKEIPQEATFLTRNGKKDPWRIATNHETIAYFGDIWKQFQK